ncbi:MAG: ABC transporter permease, partial [Myxococcales bacterium]|nr:ABC transporter permease [Myxococcales bacterium]
FVPNIVVLGITRELGPVLAGLMLAGRVSAGIAAEIGAMRVTEQIDALEVMAVDPVQYLATTRLVASILVAPFLCTIFNVAGILAGHVFATSVLGVDPGVFASSIREAVTWSDISIALQKSTVFAIFIAWISCYQGYNAQRGAMGIGAATTNSVVIISVLVLAGDYVMTALLL